jgi:hypothetical protein
MSGASAPDGDRTKVAQGRVRPAGRGAGSSASLLLGGGLSIVASTYGRRKGRLLCEQARAEACGLPLQRVRPPKPLGLTMLWADRIPRPARAAQGFHHVKDFARSVKELRARRAELQRQHPDPVRRAILDTLERILSDREDLREAARRQARARGRPRFNVWWGSGKPRVYNSVRLMSGRYCGTRDVAVPADWLLKHIDGDGNVASRVRQADPRTRILATPHWIDRVAVGALACPRFWLTVDEHLAVEIRACAIRQIQLQRCERQPKPDWRAGDMHVGGSSGQGYTLTIGGVRAHHWRYWPSRAEIARAAVQARRKLKLEHALALSPDAPDTLGWRGWVWDGLVLLSPFRRTPWHEASLQAQAWSDSAAVRGEAGIHARRVPYDWRQVDPSLVPEIEIGACNVHGIVERYGRYVLGTEGWRAEWVVIRELMAPDIATALKLMRQYPEVRVHINKRELSHEDR